MAKQLEPSGELFNVSDDVLLRICESLEAHDLAALHATCRYVRRHVIQVLSNNLIMWDCHPIRKEKIMHIFFGIFLTF